MNQSRLCVGNLSYQTGEGDLQDYFAQAGAVTSVNLMLDKMTGRSRGFAFIEFARRHGDFAMASAAAQMTVDGSGCIDRVALVVGGVAATPVRVTEGERVLKGKPLTEAPFKAAAAACKAIEPLDDIHAPAAYRLHLAEVLTGRALKKAAERLQPTGRP